MGDSSFLDRVVERLADAMNRAGLNGTRLRWRWQNYRAARAEAAEQRRVRFRTVTARHKMCPSCRSLIASGSASCPECGATVAHVRGPGPSRLLEWLLPGVAPVTGALLTANFAVFALMALTSGFAAPRGGGIGSIFQLLGFDMPTLARFGLGYGPWVLHAGEIWRLFTPLFLHAGIVHLLFNCFVLLQLGKFVEEEFGGRKMWVLYLVAGLCGGLASNFLRTFLTGVPRPYVGASGAIFGLIGVAAVFGWRRGGAYGESLRRQMITWAIYVLLFSFVVGGDNFAHVGGLVGGGLLALVVKPGPPPSAAAAWAWRLLAWAGVAACLWAFLMAGLEGPEALQRLRG